MIRWLKKCFASSDEEYPTKTLDAHLHNGHKVVIEGIQFHLRKIDPFDHLAGLNVLQQVHSTYQAKPDHTINPKMEKNFTKVREFMRDIILAGVIRPKIVLKSEDDPEATPVDDVLHDINLSQQIVENILSITYQKKNTEFQSLQPK